MHKATTGEVSAGHGWGDWQRLLDTEQQLAEQIAAVETAARAQLSEARARLDAAAPDPAEVERQAQAEAEADTRRQQAELAALEDSIAQQVQRLATMPPQRVDELAWWVLDTMLAAAAASRTP